MNDAEKEYMIRKFIDGELSPEEESVLMHSMADDDSFRKLLRLDVILKHEQLKDPFDVPADFGNSVMQKIEQKYTPKPQKESIADNILQWLRGLFQPRTIALRPAYGIAFAAFLVAFFFLMPGKSGITTNQTKNVETPNSPYITKTAEEGNSVIWMRFVYADNDAKSMAIAGDFNNWQPMQMHKTHENHQTIWTITIPLPHKEIHYMFLKNGKQWLTDPLAPQQQDDGFGHRNSVIPL